MIPNASKVWSVFSRRSPVYRELVQSSPVFVYSIDFGFAFFEEEVMMNYTPACKLEAWRKTWSRSVMTCNRHWTMAYCAVRCWVVSTALRVMIWNNFIFLRLRAPRIHINHIVVKNDTEQPNDVVCSYVMCLHGITLHHIHRFTFWFNLGVSISVLLLLDYHFFNKYTHNYTFIDAEYNKNKIVDVRKNNSPACNRCLNVTQYMRRNVDKKWDWGTHLNSIST